MFKNQYIAVILIFLVLLGGIVFSSSGLANFTSLPSSTPAPQKTRQISKAIIEIQLPGKEAEKREIEDFTNGTTALVLTQAIAQVQTKGEGERAFVTSINGYNADDKRQEFWAFYVNGKQAEIGAGTYKPKPGDVIMWKVEAY